MGVNETIREFNRSTLRIKNQQKINLIKSKYAVIDNNCSSLLVNFTERVTRTAIKNKPGHLQKFKGQHTDLSINAQTGALILFRSILVMVNKLQGQSSRTRRQVNLIAN